MDINAISALPMKKEGKATMTTNYFTPRGDGTLSIVGVLCCAESA
jgi:hypothetical protein